MNIKTIIIGASFCLGLGTLRAAEPPLNVLLITADDLGYETIDFLAGKVPGVTPNISKLATEGVSFQHGYVNAAICAPSRSVMATGRYSHNSGLYGFNKMPKKIPTVFDTFQKACLLYTSPSPRD